MRENYVEATVVFLFWLGLLTAVLGVLAFIAMFVGMVIRLACISVGLAELADVGLVGEWPTNLLFFLVSLSLWCLGYLVCWWRDRRP